MKRKWQVSLLILLYILILAAALDFNLLKLIDLRLFLLFVLGTAVLTVPFYEKGIDRRELWYIFGRKAIEAGLIQTLLLMFVGLQNSASSETFWNDIAMSFRPLLYGFCLQIIFSEKHEETAAVREMAAEETVQEDLDLAKQFQEFGLTKRELEIAGLIAEGKSNGEIAQVLFISKATVKKHISNIFEKTGAARREELVRIALGGEVFFPAHIKAALGSAINSGQRGHNKLHFPPCNPNCRYIFRRQKEYWICQCFLAQAVRQIIPYYQDRYCHRQ